MLLLLKLFRVKRCYMKNNTFCTTNMFTTIQYWVTKCTIGQIAPFSLFCKMCYLSNSTFLHLIHNLFLYKNVNLVHIYVTFLQTDTTSFHRDVIFLQRYVANLQTCHNLTLQVSHYYIFMSQFFITKSHPY